MTFDSFLPKYLCISMTIPDLIVEEKLHKMHFIVSICNNIIVVGTIDNLPQVGTICDFQKL